MKSNVRKPIAILALFAVLGVWIVVATMIGSAIATAPGLLQLIFYIVAGIGWVIPMRPIFMWMNSAPDVERGP
ncbi:MAG: DUF2842 domain-containing protein [Pseudomonadota bacterium]